MAEYPAKGSKDWDAPLKAYIDGVGDQAGVTSYVLTEPAFDAPPFVTSISEWTVDAPNVSVSLPMGEPVGTAHTVHVVGFQKILWGAGHTVYGQTSEDEVWFSAIRTELGWTVLLPSNSGGAGPVFDTGWITFASGEIAGSEATWTLGSQASVLGDHPTAPYPLGLSESWTFEFRLRRVGNRVFLSVPLLKIMEPGAVFTITMPPEVGGTLPDGFSGIESLFGVRKEAAVSDVPAQEDPDAPGNPVVVYTPFGGGAFTVRVAAPEGHLMFIGVLDWPTMDPPPTFTSWP